MKKKLLYGSFIAAIILAPGAIYAQPWVTPYTLPVAQTVPGIKEIQFQTAGSDNSVKGFSNTALNIYANQNVSTNAATGGAALFLTGNSNTASGVGPGLIRFISSGLTATNPNAIALDVLQENGGVYNPHFTILKDGRAGIGGVTNFTDKLTVNGNMGFQQSTLTDYRTLSGRTGNSGLLLQANTSSSDGAALFLNSNNRASAQGNVTIVANSGVSGTGGAMSFARSHAGVIENRMIITESGNILMGNVTDNGNYKLFVEKGILTEKIKVALKSDATNWSDFVFADDYDLKPLSEVERFVKMNKHLPEIPSAKEVYANGLDLAQMDARLLQKVEELTLYVIRQQKEIEQLKNRIGK